MSDAATGGGASRQPLRESFLRLIAATGPISVARFMAEANARYYASRDPLGAAGDFVTAPEISQMFGELIGLWLADVWRRAGAPRPVRYVELGPGRGTLARDALAAWLAGTSDDPGAWPGLDSLAPARRLSARHGAILLPFQAVAEAAALAARETVRP